MRIPAAAAVAPCHLPAGAKRVTSPGKKILICRSPGSGEPGPGTTAYVTPTHSHRGSCPASPGKPGPGAAAGAVAGFQRAPRSLSASSPDVPAGRAQRRPRHAGRAPLAGGQVVRPQTMKSGASPVRSMKITAAASTTPGSSAARRRLAAGDPAPDRRASGSGLARSMDAAPAAMGPRSWSPSQGCRGSSARADPSPLSGAPQFRCPRACGLLAPVSACKNLRFSPWFLNFPFP